MSHRRTVIEPAEGLTVLTGPNNCGKSAVVLALQTLCSNERGMSKFVRHGQKNARITVETDDNSRIEWVCEGGNVRYVVDGVRTDRSVIPDDMMPKLKLPKVSGDDGKTFDIHFSEQKDPIFLLSGGSRAATFFAASTDAGYLVKMQQILRARKSEHTQEQRYLKSAMDKLDLALEEYGPLSDIEAELEAAEKSFDTVQFLSRERRALDSCLENIERAQGQVEQNDAYEACLATLKAPPATEDEASLRLLLARLEGRLNEAAIASERSTATALLCEPPALASTVELAQTLSSMTAKQRMIALLSARLDCVEALEAPEPEIDDELLKRTIDQLHSMSVQIDRVRASAVEADREVEAVLDQVREYVTLNPECPVCGGRLDPESLIKGAHVHA